MFLVIPTEGTCPYLFFWADPRPHCPHPVVEDVDFTTLPPRNNDWHLGPAEPHVLARSRRSPKRFKIFRSELEVPMTFDILPNAAEVWASWEAFSRTAR